MTKFISFDIEYYIENLNDYIKLIKDNISTIDKSIKESKKRLQIYLYRHQNSYQINETMGRYY